MKGIHVRSTGHKVLKRYRRGRCYAAVFAPDMPDWQIIAATKEAEFLPYNEATGEFLKGRPVHFR